MMYRAFATMLITTTCGFAALEPAWAAASIDISVSETGGTGVVVYSGAAELCDPNGANCEVVPSGCGVASVMDGNIDVLDEDEKPDFITENFPFALDQEPLEVDFRVGTDSCPLALSPPNLLITPDEPGAIGIDRPISASPN